MADRRITYQIDFRTNLNNLNNLKRELQDLQRLSSNDLMSGMTKGTKATLDDVRKLHKTVTQVDVALEKAFNARLGTTNVSVFNNELKKSGLTLQQIANTFNMAGVQGQNAFRNLANQVMTNNTQLKETTNFMTKIQTTLANTLKWNLSSSVINQLTGTIQQAYGYVQHLDRSLNDIRVVTGLSADEMKEFAVQANDAAKALGAGTTDYTEASLIYFQQGKTSEESQQLADVTLKAANVTGQSAAEVSEELTAVWNGYQVSAEQAELYVDKLAAVAATTASDLEELSTGMSKVASAANAMGVDVDSLNAQLATIISVTRQAPESVGTALKTIYARMGDIEAGLDDEISLGGYTSKMADLGVNVLDANDELRNMGEVIDEVGGKWETMSREQQIALAQIMAGTRQYNNLVALFDNWDMYTQAIETSAHAAGTLQEQQDIYMQSTAAHLQTLRTTWEDVYDSVLSTELLNPAIDVVTKFVDLFGTTIDSIGGSESVFMGLGAIITKVFSEEAGRAFSAWRNNANYAKAATAELADKLKILEQASNIKGLNRANENFVKMRANLEKLSRTMKPEEYRQIADEFDRLNGLMTRATGFENAKNDMARFAQELTKSKISFDEFANNFEHIQAAFAGIQLEDIADRFAEFNDEWTTSFARWGDSQDFTQSSSNVIGHLRRALTAQIDQIGDSDIKERYQEELTKIFAVDNVDDAGMREHVKAIQEFVNNLMNDVTGVSNPEMTESLNNLQQESAETAQNIANSTDTVQESLDSVSTQHMVTNIMNGVSAISSIAMSVNSFATAWDTLWDEDLEPLEKTEQILTSMAFTIPTVISAFKTLIEVTGRVSFKDVAVARQEYANAQLAAHQARALATAKAEAAKAAATEASRRATAAELATNRQATDAERQRTLAAEASARAEVKKAEASAAAAKAQELETVESEKAKIANDKLNASFLRSPYFIVIAAIVSLAAVIATVLIKAEKEAREEAAKSAKEQVDNTQKIIEAKQQEIDAIEEIKKSYEELNEQYKNNEISMQEMRSSLYDLYMEHGMLNEAIQASTASYSDFEKQINNAKQVRLDEIIASEATQRSQIKEAMIRVGTANGIKSTENLIDYTSYKGTLTSNSKDIGDGFVNFNKGLTEILGVNFNDLYTEQSSTNQDLYTYSLNFNEFLNAYIGQQEEVSAYLTEQINKGNQYAKELDKILTDFIDEDIKSDLTKFNQNDYFGDIAERTTLNISNTFDSFSSFSQTVEKLVSETINNESYGLTEADTDSIRDAILQKLGKNSENAEYILKDALLQAIKEAGIIDTKELQTIIAELSMNEAKSLQLNLPVIVKLTEVGLGESAIKQFKQVAEQVDILAQQLDIKIAFDDFINTKDIDASINTLFSKYEEITIGTQTFTKEMVEAMNPGEQADFLISAWHNVTYDLEEQREEAEKRLQQIQKLYEINYNRFNDIVQKVNNQPIDIDTWFNSLDSSERVNIDFNAEKEEEIRKLYKDLNAERIIELYTTEDLTEEEKLLKDILLSQLDISEARLVDLISQYQLYQQTTNELVKASTIEIDPFKELRAGSLRIQTSLEDLVNLEEVKKQAKEFQKALEESNGTLTPEMVQPYYELSEQFPDLIQEVDGKLEVHIGVLKEEEKALSQTRIAAEENLAAAEAEAQQRKDEVTNLERTAESMKKAGDTGKGYQKVLEDLAIAKENSALADEEVIEADRQATAARNMSISSTVNLKNVYKEFSDSISNLNSSYNALLPVIEDFNDGGQFSLSSLNTLLTTGYDFLEFLSYENGQLKLSSEAIKQKTLDNLDEACSELSRKMATEGVTDALSDQLDLINKIEQDIISGKIDLLESSKSPWKDWEAPDIDKTQDVISELSRIEDKIKDLQEEEKKLSGEDLLNNLAEQKKLLEDKAKKQEEYVNLLKDEQKLQQDKSITLKDKTNNKSTSVTLRGMGAQFDEDGNLLNRVSLEQRAAQNVQSHAWTPEQYNQFISALDDYTKATDNWAKAVDDHNKIADEIDETDIKTAETDANKGEDEKKSILESTAYTIDNLTKEYEDLQDAEKTLSGNELINHYKTESQILDDLNSKLKTQKQHYEGLAKEDRETLSNKFDAKFDEDGNIANLKELMDSSEWKIIEKYVESYNENLKQARDIGKQINQNRDALVEKEKESINVLDEEISKLEDERQKLEESLEDVAPEDAGEKLGQIGNIIDKEISKLKEEKSVLLNNIKLWRARAIEAAFKGDANAAAYWLNQIKEANFDLKDINNRLEEIKDTSESVDLFSQLDKAYSVNRELSKIERQLGRMQKAQDGLEGDELIKNLQQQQVLIQREIALMNKKIQIQTKDLKIAQSKLKVTLATLAAEEGLNLNVKFDSQTGEIENYLEVLSGIQNLSEPVFNSIQSIMDAINSSATDILDLRDNLEDLQYDYQDTADAIFEEQQRLIEESKKTEEEIVEEVEDATDALEEELARRLKLFHAEIDVNIDANEAQRQLDALQRKLDGLKDTDILGNAQAALDDFKSYYGSIGDIDLLTGHVNDIMGEIEIMKSGLASSLYGTDIEAAFDDLANYRDQLLSSLEAMQELVKQVEDSYLQQIDKISSKISDQISNYNQITSMIEHDSNLIKLLRGDDEYKKLANYYKQLETNYNAELGFLKKEVDYWRDKMESVEEGSEEWEKYQQEWKNAVSEFNSTVDSAVQNVIDKYKNAVNDIFDNWQKKLTGGFKLDDAAERWELAKKASDMYLDSVEKGYELQVLENKYRESINNTDDIEQQQQLNALMEERLKKLREQDKLSQYDIDRANLEYEMTLKQIALEESRNNKTSMRLRRDSQGNYRYEYVANEEDVIEKQQELLDLQNQIYELDKDKYRTNLDEVISIYQEFQNKLYDLYSDQTLTEEERELKKKQLIEDYGAIINNYIADNEAIRQNLQQSSFDMLEDLYAEDAVKFQNMTQQEIDDAMGILIPGWDGIIQQMIDSFAGAGGLAPSCEEALNDLGLVTQDYEQSLADIEQAANISFGDIISGVDQTIPAMDELISTNEELLDKYDQELQAIADLIDQLHALQDAYASTTQAALDAIQAAIDLGREAASTLNELQALTGATSNANSQANALNQAQQSGSGEDTRDMRASPTFGHAVVRFNKVVDKNTGKTGFVKHGDVGNSQFYENIDDFYSGHGTTVNTSDLINADTGRKYDERDKWSFATGGYTGEWGPEGRAAILHEKELVLNKTDTDNILKAVFALRDYAKNQFNFNPFAMLMDSIKSNLQSNLFNLIPNLSAASAIDSPSSALSQNVHIDASFPNVQSSNEIEQAINNLVNTASQYILNNNR